MKPNQSFSKVPGAALYQTQRAKMVEMLRQKGIRDENVLQVMSKLPRHLFVPEALAASSYGDHALPIGDMQTISQPFMVALMTELLEVTKESTVLEIGAGSGYQTAVLSALAGRVFALERIAELARFGQANIRNLGCYNATIKCFDGTMGWSEFAPYEAILVAAGSPDIPEPLVAQLALGGRLVIPVGNSPDKQVLVRVIKTENGIHYEEHGSCVFVKLIGRHGWQT